MAKSPFKKMPIPKTVFDLATIFIVWFCFGCIATCFALSFSPTSIYSKDITKSSRVLISFRDSERPYATEILSGRELYISYVYEICSMYDNVSPEIIISIIEQESRFIPNVSNGNHVGLMQVSTKWHGERAAQLGVTDLYDPYGNILTGIDYFSDLIRNYSNNDVTLALMLYSMDNKEARQLYSNGQVSYYAKTVLSRAKELEVELNAKG